MSDGATRENLLYTLPSVLAGDRGMSVLGDTAAAALAVLWERLDLPTIYSRIDQLPESLVDILAKDFAVDWYDYDLPLETKRAVLKDSFYVHRHLGTAGAVKRALSDVWPSFSLEEWFNYGGEPYHFRVAIADSDFTVEKKKKAVRLINLVKNVRSWLDDIYTQVIGNIVIEESAAWTFVEGLTASQIQYTNANDIGDWEQVDVEDAAADVTFVGMSILSE